jgi:hypothetical protein
MLQVTVHIREYPGCWGVRAYVSDVDDFGLTHHLVESAERLVALEEPSGDPLQDLYRALVTWCRVSE